MSVIGFDVGNLLCYTACARGGGIETLANEYSARHTPSFVSFSGRRRLMGTASHQAVVTNLKNTFYNLKRFVGRSFDDPRVQTEKDRFGPAGIMTRGADGGILFETRYMEETKQFTPEQLLAALLTKLKENAELALDNKVKVTDCVLSVPSYFTEQQRRKVLEASQMANLNCLKLMNETTAVALSYGIYKQDLPPAEEAPRNVVFVDFGQSSLQASVAAMHKGKLKMLATAADGDVGGRDFDLRLAEKFAADFQAKRKMDVKAHPRSFLRLLAECEKMKKTMSANATEIPINVECLVEEIDFSGKMKRDDFEALCEDLLARIKGVFEGLMARCGLTADQIHSVEVVGGASRIPAVKRLVSQVFGQEPSTTLNSDEAVARGCALQCAILSPTFRVRDFNVEDCQNFPIDMVFENADGHGEQRMEVFPARSAIPSSKILTFYRKEPFRLKVEYGKLEDEAVFPYDNSVIGEYLVNEVVPTEDGEPSKVKVKVRVDLHGIFKVSNAQLVVKKEEPVVEEVKPMETGEGDVAAAEAPASAANGDAAATAAPPTEATSEPPKDAEESASSAVQGEEKMDDGTVPSETEQQQQQQQQQQPEETQSEAQPPSPKKKSKVITTTLKVETKNSSMDAALLTRLHEIENEMISQDRQERDRLVAKNSLEEYVIEMRRKCGEELERFVEEAVREDFVRKLDGVEDWLYEDGEDELKSVYVAKLKELETIGDPIVDRHRQFELRPVAFENLEMAIKLANAFVARRENEEFAHITTEEFDQVAVAATTAAEWCKTKLEEQAKKPLTEAPVVVAAVIDAERQKLQKAVDGIAKKPKPKKTEEAKKKGENEEKKDDEKENEKKAGEEEEEGKNVQPEEVNKETKMETETGTEGGIKDQTNEMDLD